MKIGVDIDSVTCKLMPSVLEHIQDKFGLTLTPEDIKSWNPTFETSVGVVDIGKEIRECFREDGFLESLPTIDGAKEALEEISKKHKVFIITSRWIGRYWETVEWVYKNLGKYPVLFSNGSKSGYGLDILIDDCPETLIDFYGSSRDLEVRPIIIFNQPWNRDLHYLPRANSWNEVLNLLAWYK
jgi:5'(3')-deoxyribonucleotidase